MSSKTISKKRLKKITLTLKTNMNHKNQYLKTRVLLGKTMSKCFYMKGLEIIFPILDASSAKKIYIILNP